MNKSQLAAQLYTLRDFCQDASGLAESLRRVREIGYPGVQVSGIGPIAPAEVRRICDGEGLTICATHESADLVRRSPEKVIERLHDYGCEITAYPYPAGVDFSDASQLESLVQDLAGAGAKLADAGLSLAYHNHAVEFVRAANGRPWLETLFERIPAAHLGAELDTYWVQFGGGDPVAWCERMAGRMQVIHLKDYGFTAENEPVFAEVGHGNLDMRRIIAAAEKSGCRWFVVEQDVCPGDPFDSLQKSHDYLATIASD